MKTKQLKASKFPNAHYDKVLDKYQGKVLFKDKLEKANETLKNVGLPKERRKDKSRRE